VHALRQAGALRARPALSEFALPALPDDFVDLLSRTIEWAMQRFRSPKTLQKFSSVHAQVHNQFNQERHLVTRQVYKQRRSAALAEWRALAA
jgi:hypothetical protein